MRPLRVLGPPVVLATIAAGCSGDGPDADPTVPTPAPVSTVAVTAASATTVAPTATASTTTSSPTSAPESTSGATTTVTSEPPNSTIPPAPPPPNEAFAGLRLGVDLIVDIEHPTAVAWRPRDEAMYVATQDGLVLRFDGEETNVVLDLTDRTVPFAPGSERGLLGLAFDPRDGRLFVDYTDLDGNSNVVSFELEEGVADPASVRSVLFIEQPGPGHNGGRLLFDEAGNLYVSSGDGGASSGRDVEDTTKLLGVILRITPRLDGDGYDIPPDNPFVDGTSDRPEVWARGFRNPWTFSIDRATGDMWIGDVGNDTREEVSVMRAGNSGQHFGWPWYEGNHQRRRSAPDGLTPPVYDYPRSVGVAVMGGFVYRGREIPELVGAYLFGDLGGPVFAIGAGGVSALDAERVTTLVGWGEDEDGELYLLSLRDGVYRLVRR